MSVDVSLDIDAWNRYVRGEYVPDRLPPEAEPTAEEPGGTRLHAATDVCLRCHRAVSAAQAREYTQLAGRGRRQAGCYAVGRLVRLLESEALAAWATDSEFLDNAHFTAQWLAQGRMGGAEHEVYFDPGTQRWFKRNNLAFHNTYLEYFYQLALHNFLFPEAPVCLEGFVISSGWLLPVLSQPNVRADQGAPRATTEATMQLFGFVRQRDDNDYNRDLGILAEDLHDENVVIGEDHSLYAIDPVLYLDDRGKGLRLRRRTEVQD